jgi:hypothetical protein
MIQHKKKKILLFDKSLNINRNFFEFLRILMNPESSFLEKVKESNNIELLNDLLIELAKSPTQDHLEIVDFIIKNKSEAIKDKLIINLSYLIGKVGKKTQINNKYVNYLRKNYTKHDRWVRNEIIKALNDLVPNNFEESIYINILEKALREEYEPIILNSLDILEKLEKTPNELLSKLLYLLNNPSKNVKKKLKKILKNEIRNEIRLYEFLSEKKRYKILQKEGIRNLLLTFFQYIVKLESFRELILNSDWDQNLKSFYLKEIDTFQKILLSLI